MAILTNKQFFYIGAAAVAGVVLTGYMGKKAVATVVDTGEAILSGDNALTEDTPYEGYGVLGSLGAAANKASGGTLQKIGESLGETLFDWFGPKYEEPKGTLIDGDYKVIQQLNSEKSAL